MHAFASEQATVRVLFIASMFFFLPPTMPQMRVRFLVDGPKTKACRVAPVVSDIVPRTSSH